MAKKRASGKRQGTDAGGQPYDLSNTEDYRKALHGLLYFANTKAERRVARRQLQDFRANENSPVRMNLNKIGTYLPDKSQIIERSRPSIAMGAAKGDPLAGRTVEAGTRSLREGLRAWMRDLRGGGGSRLTGR